jgi:hypothetical protein
MKVIVNAVDSVEMTVVFADNAPDIAKQVGTVVGVKARFPILG